MDYKETLQMPKTDFEMRGNLANKEPGFVERWKKQDHYQNILKQHEGQPLFILHDGPPYANGNLHAGTAMNRIIKDFIIRSHAMLGYSTPFVPGWDTHGLPIENALIRQGVDRKSVTPMYFRAQCRDYALGQIDIQRETMKRLGTIGDFDHPYITLTKEFEAAQIRTFAKMALEGLIYQGLKPVYWSPASESALAESEIVYKDKEDTTIYVKFKVKDGKGILDPKSDWFVIWTTTPWTIPANLAICLHPSFTYALVKTSKGNLVMLESFVPSLMEAFGLSDYQVLKTFKGAELEGILCIHPLYPDSESLVILGEHVTDEDGTGCVHTAPGHGAEDFYIGTKYNLPAFCPVDEKGCMTAAAGEQLAGQFVDDASKTVIALLKDSGNLLYSVNLIHSYPYDDRMKRPIIFRATVQWFASIDKIREQLLAQIHQVHWLNEWGEVRLYNMIRDRGDWCISRQRLWGLPIPIFYTEKKTPIMDAEVFEHVAQLFGEYGSNIWFEKEAKELLPDGYSHPDSPNGLFTKEQDIMDVWFDSGSTHNVLNQRGYPYPADLYFEGSDQYRGWFNSSLIVGVATKGQAPYKSVLSHGYVLDAKGEKMSKSLGNVVNPLDVIKVNGADVLRLWAANIDFRQDIRIGDDILKQVSDQYRKIRNTFRFLLGNLNKEDFDSKRDLVNYEELEPVDKHLLVLLAIAHQKIVEAYQAYDYLAVTETLFVFLANTMSAYYLDFTKDILYIENKNAKRRRQVQSVLWEVLDTLLRDIAPILCFTSEEVYDRIKDDESDSIHYQSFCPVKSYDDAKALIRDFTKLFALREEVFKAMEVARDAKVIGKPLEAHILLKENPELQEVVKRCLGDSFAQWLTVSKVSFVSQSEAVLVQKAEGFVCDRCWNIVESVNEAGLCARCAKILEES
ncbi:MAG: isoleucine--tRNA ligase [Erysipelotrichaceae bacterium]|jgi:isoleucyl-tRNA synthetase|nr:isoleucine--tRNA ligase [Erysipelotrichaceae bacterium]